jgi:putative Mn2+ efflux pump MntP
LSEIGIKIGNVFGVRYKSKAEFVGGAVLILMGIKILLEHLGFLPF